jgi:transketolase
MSSHHHHSEHQKRAAGEGADTHSPKRTKSSGLDASNNGHDGFEEGLTRRCIDTIRVVAADTVEKGKSGHPGAPMGCAPIAHLLFGEHMRFDPHAPTWSNRDRFVLSNGHASALLYTMLHLTGYAVSMDDLQHFRQLGTQPIGFVETMMWFS